LRLTKKKELKSGQKKPKNCFLPNYLKKSEQTSTNLFLEKNISLINFLACFAAIKTHRQTFFCKKTIP